MNKKSLAFVFIFLLVLSVISYSSALAEYNLTYDGNGNLISGDGKYREYNEFNQLIKIYQGNDSSGDLLEEYIHHPTGDRVLVKKVHLDDTDGPEETIVYVNENFVRRYDLTGIREVNDTYYVRDDLGLVGEVVFFGNDSDIGFTQGRKIYYHNDYMGSTSAITNESGDIIEETFYDPYGDILEGGSVSRYSYEGKELSAQTEEYDFDFRKYDPELMVFTQPDSGVQDIYDPQSLNRYSFERNNPYKYIDPNGKFAVVPLLIAGGIAALVGAGFYGLGVISGKHDFTWKGLGGYTVGGFVGGFAGAGAVMVAGAVGLGTALGVTSLIGISAAGDVASQIISNYGTDSPLSEGVLSAGVFGGLTAGFSKYLPDPGIYRIKYTASYFTKKTGWRYLRNIAITESSYNTLMYNLGTSDVFNFQSYHVDQTKETAIGSGNPRGSTSYYYDENSGGCVCRLPPPEEEFWERIGIDPNPPSPFNN